jgi:hypothetical protein
MSTKDELLVRATDYAKQHGLLLRDELGFGVHGIVFVAKNQAETSRSAVKIHRYQEPYQRERDIYLRLRDRRITAVRECTVPGLLNFDDDLCIIEMSVVSRPYVLDFAGAYLDKRPDFSDEVMADWHSAKQEQFGGRWPEVLAVIGILETYGIFMEDVSPNNVALPD